MGDAEYMIENGIDPFIKPDGAEWPDGINPIYEEKTESTEQPNIESEKFNSFQDAMNWAKKNPGKTITRCPSGIGFIKKNNLNANVSCKDKIPYYLLKNKMLEYAPRLFRLIAGTYSPNGSDGQWLIHELKHFTDIEIDEILKKVGEGLLLAQELYNSAFSNHESVAVEMKNTKYMGSGGERHKQRLRNRMNSAKDQLHFSKRVVDGLELALNIISNKQ